MIFLRRFRKYIIVNVTSYFRHVVKTKAINWITIGIFQNPEYITFIFSRRIVDLDIKDMKIHIYKTFCMVKKIPRYNSNLECILYSKFKHMNKSDKTTLKDIFTLKYHFPRRFRYETN